MATLTLTLDTLLKYQPHTPSLLSIPPSPTSPASPTFPIFHLSAPSKNNTNNTKNNAMSSQPQTQNRNILPPTPPLTPPGTTSTSSSTLDYSLSTRSSSSAQPSPPPPPPPPEPLPWHWQCHHCHRTYSLSVTRRCLDDGHHFCSGEPLVSPSSPPPPSTRRSEVDVVGGRGSSNGRARRQRNDGRKSDSGRARSRARSKSYRRGKACASEFDYAGWRAWGEWRRAVCVARARAQAQAEAQNQLQIRLQNQNRNQNCNGSGNGNGSRLSITPPSEEEISDVFAAEFAQPERGSHSQTRYGTETFKSRRNCEGDCDYPSECRWGPLSVQSRSPVMPVPLCVPAAGAAAGSVHEMGISGASTDLTSEDLIMDGDAMDHEGERKVATSFEEILGLLEDDEGEDGKREADAPDDIEMTEDEGEEEIDEASTRQHNDVEQVNALARVKSYGHSNGMDIVVGGSLDPQGRGAGQGGNGYVPAWLRA